MLTNADEGRGGQKKFNKRSLRELKMLKEKTIDLKLTIYVKQSHTTCKLDPNKLIYPNLSCQKVYVGGTGQYLVVLGHYWVVLVSTWWYWVNIGWYWSVLDGTGSILGGTGQYLVVLGHYWVVLVSTWWYLVNIGWYWSVLCVLRSILDCSGQNYTQNYLKPPKRTNKLTFVDW